MDALSETTATTDFVHEVDILLSSYCCSNFCKLNNFAAKSPHTVCLTPEQLENTALAFSPER